VRRRGQQPSPRSTAAVARRAHPFPDPPCPDRRSGPRPTPLLGRQLRDPHSGGGRMTATTVDEIDTRSTWQRQLDEETPADEFSEAEMNMIDIAAVHVYKKARAVLPSELIDFRDEDRKDDPAGAIRQWAHQWAREHPSPVNG